MKKRILALLLAAISCTAVLHSQCQPYWSSFDAVSDVAGGGQTNVLWDPDGPGPLPEQLVTGGSFDSAGSQLAANVAAFDFATGTWSPLGAGVNGQVHALAVLQTGELVVAGEFLQAGGAPAHSIAMWDGAAWSPLGLGIGPGIFPDLVRALVVMPNGDLIAGGDFFQAGGISADNIARWDGSAWSAIGSYSGRTILSMCVATNGDLLIGSEAVAGTGPPLSISRWDGSQWSTVATLPLYPSSPPFTPNGHVWAILEMPNGDIVAGGRFGNVGGSSLAAARWDGSTWSPLGTSMDLGRVHSFALAPNGDLVMTGNIELNGVRTAVAIWNGTTTMALGSNLTGAARSPVHLPGGDLIAGSDLPQPYGVPLALDGGNPSHVRFDGVAWSSLVPQDQALDERVLCLESLPDGDFLAGGRFTEAGSTVLNRITRRSGTTWEPLGNGFPSATSYLWANAVAVMPGGDVVVATNSVGLSRWDGTTWTSFGAGLGPLASVNSMLVMPNGDLIVGGWLNSYGHNGIARWNGASWSPIGSGFGGSSPYVLALASMPNGDLVAGGSFNTAGGAPANNIARWDGSAWSALDSGTNDRVHALATLPNGDLVAGGEFSFAGGVLTTCIARWDGTQWHSFGSGLGMFQASSRVVHAIGAMPNGDVLAGGYFGSAGSVVVTGLARWKTATASWSAVGSLGVGAEVFALEELSTGEWIVGGDFHSADALPANFIVRLTGDCLATVDTVGAGCIGSGGVNELVADNLPWIGNGFVAQASGLPSMSLATVVYGFQPVAIPLPTILPQAGAGCELLAAPDVIELALPNAGLLTTQLSIPNTPSLTGIELHEQVVAFEVDAQGAFVEITSTNGLQVTIGSF